ncbi:MAG: hypothetical protein WC307_03320 [Candidatus Nanoarchaeia archaeon]|jgi:hypothetical protein
MNKIDEIINFFDFKNLDDLILRLNKAVAHSIQESIHTPGLISRRCKGISIIDDVYDSMPNRIITFCVDFSELTKQLGKALGYEVELITCYPKYLNNNYHWLIKSSGVFKDPSIYNKHYNNGKWVKTKPELMLNVPEEQLGKHWAINLDSFYKKKAF